MSKSVCHHARFSVTSLCGGDKCAAPHHYRTRVCSGRSKSPVDVTFPASTCSYSVGSPCGASPARRARRISGQKEALETPKDVVVGTARRILQASRPLLLRPRFVILSVPSPRPLTLLRHHLEPSFPLQHLEEQNMFLGDVKTLVRPTHLPPYPFARLAAFSFPVPSLPVSSLLLLTCIAHTRTHTPTMSADPSAHHHAGR